jgi:hypothetical protein
MAASGRRISPVMHLGGCRRVTICQVLALPLRSSYLTATTDTNLLSFTRVESIIFIAVFELNDFYKNHGAGRPKA